MSEIKSNKYFINMIESLFVSIVIFSIIFTSLVKSQELPGKKLDGLWSVIGEDLKKIDVNIPYSKYIKKVETLTFQKNIDIADEDIIVILRPGTHAIEVRINGEFIYGIGDLNNPASAIWNSAIPLMIPTKWRNQNVNLEIILSDPFFIGLTADVFIGYNSKMLPYVSGLNWVFNSFLLMSCGASLIIGLILIGLGVFSKSGWNYYRYMGFATIFVAIYGIDFIFQWSLGSTMILLIFKRICVSFGLLSSLCFLMGIENFFLRKLKYSLYMGIPTVITIIIALFLQPASLVWSSMPLIAGVIFVNLLIMIFLILGHRVEKEGFLLPAFLLILSLGQTMITLALKLELPFILQYIVIAAAILFGIRLIADFSMIFLERERLLAENILDPLTGLYNRRILHSLELTINDSVALLDLDNFKTINDVYGHKRGDDVLKMLSEILRTSFRREDILIRLGGDEFMVVVRYASPADAVSALTRVDLRFKNSVKDAKTGVSFGVTRYFDSIENSIKEADKLMYENKEQRKVDRT